MYKSCFRKLINPDNLVSIQARGIQELALRVFHALRTDPENFELEFSQPRRRPGRKTHGEPTKLVRCSRLKFNTGVSPKRNTKTDRLFTSTPHFHTTKREKILPSGNINSTARVPSIIFCIIHPLMGPWRAKEDSLNFPLLWTGSGGGFETERRRTYRPWTSYSSENESMVSSLSSAPKPLIHVSLL